MTKYGYAERVAAKVKKLLKFDTQVQEIVRCQPIVQLDAGFFLQSLVWNYYNYSVVVTTSGVALSDGSQTRILLKYNGFDELLAMR